MADVRPFKALHYDLGKVGSLDAVAAPPYDVIDAAGRAALLRRSPYNAVAIDLPKPFDPADPASDPDGDPYERADAPAEAVRSRRPGERPRWRPLRGRGADDRRLAARRRPGRRRGAVALGPDPGLRRSRRLQPQPPRDPRPGAGGGLRERRHPPARAHPPRAAAGPARADPGDRPQPLADLLAQQRGRLGAGRAGPRPPAPGG